MVTKAIKIHKPLADCINEGEASIVHMSNHGSPLFEKPHRLRFLDCGGAIQGHKQRSKISGKCSAAPTPKLCACDPTASFGRESSKVGEYGGCIDKSLRTFLVSPQKDGASSVF